jgi:inosine-uridine nucleoside N-ribohydrolase
VDVLSAAIAGAADPVVLVALGPLTNVADLLASQPNASATLADIVVMGGAVDVPGNVGGENDLAEWNLFVDPAAANDVLRSGAPVTLVALDACGDVPVTVSFIDRLRVRAMSPSGAYVVNLLTAQDEFVRSGGYFFWDPLAAAIAIDGRLAGFLDRRLGVDVATGGPSGRVVARADGGLVRLAVSADAAGFERSLLETLSGAPGA